jgi:peptidyl-prolyl cis-trans isomerase D
MFNLFRTRQKTVRFMLTVLLGAVALSMVVYLIPGFGQSGTKADDPTVAEIGGNKITTQEVLVSANSYFAGKNVPPELLEMYMPQFVDTMIQQRAIVYEFENMGFSATDDEVYNAMMATFPQFFQNGAMVNKDQFELYLNQQGMTVQQAIDQVRQGLILMKVQNIQFAATVVTAKEVDDAVGQKFDKAKVKYVAFPPEKFKADAKTTPEEIKNYFNARRANYPIPEKHSFTALVLDQEKVEQTITVTDKQLHDAYQANLDNFRLPERVHVRHILLMTQNKSDAEKKQALTKAQDILKQLKNGGDFAQLAAKNSEDTSNASKGGDLGWVVHGQMVAEFEKASFALQPKQTSDIVTTQFGYHIINELERDSARLKPFDEVKASLTDELRKQGISEKMQATSDQMHAALAKAPGSAAEIAKQFGASVITQNNVEAGAPIPTLGVSQEIDGALAQLKKNEVSPMLVLPANRVAVVVLTDKTPTREAELNEVESKVRDQILTDKAAGVAAEKAKEAAGRMRAGEDMAKVAKSYGLTVTESIEFTHSDSVEGLGGAVQIPDAFTKPVGSVIGPINDDLTRPTPGMPRNLVYQVVDQVHVDPAKLANERQGILGELKKTRASREFELFMDSVFSKMIADKKVVIHKDAIKRLSASLRR